MPLREVDQVLARAYGPRRATTAPGTGEPHARPPAPHFPLEPRHDPHPGEDSAASYFAWPETIRLLEREHGDRFERLADLLEENRRRRHLRILLFTSCSRAEGRSTLVLTLARTLARRPGRTLIVDADLSGPMLASQLGLRPRFGLEDVVEQGVALPDALIHSPDDRLTLLPLRAAVGRPREFLASAGWSCLMARLRREFDLVLLDGSPLFTGLSAAVLHSAVDAAILVHHRGITAERVLLRAQEVLDAGGIPLLGLAATFVPMERLAGADRPPTRPHA